MNVVYRSTSGATTPPDSRALPRFQLAQSPASGERGRAPYNRCTTRRAPTGADQSGRTRLDTRSVGPGTRTDADQHQQAQTTNSLLITRRSRVQILPPPPSNTRSEALSERSERASCHCAANTPRTSANAMAPMNALRKACRRPGASSQAGASRLGSGLAHSQFADLRVAGGGPSLRIPVGITRAIRECVPSGSGDVRQRATGVRQGHHRARRRRSRPRTLSFGHPAALVQRKPRSPARPMWRHHPRSRTERLRCGRRCWCRSCRCRRGG